MSEHEIPATAPLFVETLPHEGSGVWTDGLVDYSWMMQDVSDRNELMGTDGRSLLVVVKVKVRERRLFKRLMWIQYTEAQVDGKLYIPPISPDHPHGWEWRGIDRYPNNNRPDKLPYSNLLAEQDASDWGAAYEGRVRTLYSPGDSDSVFVDWASAGDNTNWGHYSVLSLIGRGWAGSEWRLGSLMWRYDVGLDGTFKFGARLADEGDFATWLKYLAEGNVEYMKTTYKGDYRAAIS
jgi:hypothetical protein